MHSIRRLSRILFDLARDKQYRARTLNTIAYQLKQVDSDQIARTASWVAEDCLKSKRFYLVGGCELTYIKDALAYYGASTYHTFDHGGNVDPLAEAQNPNPLMASFQPDFIVLSQIQQLRGFIQKLQLCGFESEPQEQRRDLAAIVGDLRHAAKLLFEVAHVPQFILTYPLMYRPALGLHEYKSCRHSLCLIEVMRNYALEVYQTAKELEQAYVLDTDLILESCGKQHTIRDDDADGIYEHFSKAGSLEVAHSLIAQTQALNSQLPRVKCAVFDLDGTLWDGVLREDGAAGVQVKTNFFSMLNFLNRRGILLAICSKNDHNIEQQVRELLGPEIFDHFSLVVLNWNPKSQNLKAIATQLEIGLDTLALFDDSPFEREEVKTNAPQVMVFDPQDLLGIVQTPAFVPPGIITPEATDRAKKYKQQAIRREVWEKHQHTGDRYEQFLKASNLRLAIRRPLPGELSRVLEIIQRANQLNATQKRLTAAKLQSFYADEGRRGIWSAWLTDKFGDYGMIGVCIVAKVQAEWEIVELVVSCRAMGRRVEHALLCHVMHEARRQQAPRISIRAALGDTNQQMIDMLRDMEFQETHGDANHTREVHLQRPLAAGIPQISDVASWLEIHS